MKKHPALLLFTHMYPFGEGENFLNEELPYLLNYFNEIILIPNQLGTFQRRIPKGVRVETGFAKSLEGNRFKKICKRLIAAFTSQATYQELAANPSIFLKPACLRILIYFTSQSEFYYAWLNDYLKINPSHANALFYTYWLHIQCHSIALLKKRKCPGLKLISRAHSYEIYLEDYPPCYLPFRKEDLPFINQIYTISHHGKERLLKEYESSIQSISTAPLGVRDPGFLNPHPESNTLSLVSTSALVPLKRINLIIDGLQQFCDKQPGRKLIWNHFGGGELADDLHRYAQKKLGSRIDWKFHGQVSSEQLLTFYQTTPIDLFINTSATEGIPVSIMEAISCGIPVIATDVGAVSEIVNTNTGLLLNTDPSPSEIAQAIAKLTHDKSQLKTLRMNAHNYWKEHYHAEKNYGGFAQKIHREAAQ
jgi:glycosyltransferase involved in cell wall biosynthesis